MTPCWYKLVPVHNLVPLTSTTTNSQYNNQFSVPQPNEDWLWSPGRGSRDSHPPSNWDVAVSTLTLFYLSSSFGLVIHSTTCGTFVRLLLRNAFDAAVSRPISATGVRAPPSHYAQLCNDVFIIASLNLAQQNTAV
jgi:hypothetical protein